MSSSSILDKIISTKQKTLEIKKNQIPIGDLLKSMENVNLPKNFSGSLMGDTVMLIAEMKKASPSKGLITESYEPKDIALTYSESNVAAISILTDHEFFQGELSHLEDVSHLLNTTSIPVFRKDFIIDEYQIYESRVHGADSLLLMVSALENKQLKHLITVCNSLWIQPLVETHNQIELEIALDAGAEIIGINHRNLHDFSMDMNLVEKLRPFIPQGKIIVAESGINTHQDVQKMKFLEVNAVLVGESIMKAQNIRKKIQELMGTNEG
jgi:indole-3-glycerol phosphate synthase